ncbi:MAG: NAD-dependent epimerase/dehydratase family protein [Candidatus Coproplasma sp.]
MKKVVLTGGTGMIGIALVNRLVELGCDVLVLYLPQFLKQGALPNSQHVKLAVCDLADLDKFDYFEHNFDTFIHLGWQATIGDGRDNADLQESNIKMTLDAVRLAKRLGCNTFVGTGSQAEFGPKEEILTTNLACNPESGYGIAKFAAGKLSRLLANQLDMRHCWVRILSIFGPYDNPNTLISYLIKSILNGEKPVLTKCEQDWDYLYVEDCANAICCVADKGINGKAYPIGGGQARKLSEYVTYIRDTINPNVQLGFGEKEYPPHQPMYLCADITELINDTGYNHKYGFEKGIKKTIEFMKRGN